MEIISTIILTISVLICQVLAACFIRWYVWRRAKSERFAHNLIIFTCLQAMILIVAVQVNGMFMLANGSNDSDNYYTLIPITISLLLGIMCKEVLTKNYQDKVIEGKPCHFIVTCVLETELYGYAILDGENWLPAKASIVSGKDYEEQQQLVAVICSKCSDDNFVVVRIC